MSQEDKWPFNTVLFDVVTKKQITKCENESENSCQCLAAYGSAPFETFV